MAGTSSFRRREKKFSKKMQRTLDPAMLLSRGLSARFVGANVVQYITPLSKDEMEKDLRHMNAYYQANVAYAQQHYIYMNGGQFPGAAAASGSESNNMTMVAPVAMPVRIDPEEEKRLQNLRKKIVICETQREFLESQYVSLRAHYVATTKELAAASKSNEGLVAFLQNLTKRRAKVLALQRARLQISRDVLACLQTRMEGLQAAAQRATTATVGTSNGESKIAIVSKGDSMQMDMDSPEKIHATRSTDESSKDDIVEVWNELEEMLKEAELACRKIPSTLTVNEKKSRKKPKKGAAAGESEEETTVGALPWDAIKLPNTPKDVPVYISQLSEVPEKGGAFGTNGIFGSKKSSMCWMESSMPSSYNSKEEELKVNKLIEEVQFLENELTKEREANRDIQVEIVDRRKRSDELVAMMTLLRSETEAILQRHNILLDSNEAKKAAKKLHEAVVKERAAKAEVATEEGGSSKEGATNGEAEKVLENGATKKPASDKPKSPKDDDENDGDDEGEAGEDDEEGEITEKGGWGERGSKRNLDGDAGPVNDPPPLGGRKRRKL